MAQTAGYEKVIEAAVKKAVAAIPGLKVQSWNVATRSLQRTAIAYGKLALNREISAAEKLVILDAINEFSATHLESQRRGSVIFFWDDAAYRPEFKKLQDGSTRAVYHPR